MKCYQNLWKCALELNLNKNNVGEMRHLVGIAVEFFISVKKLMMYTPLYTQTYMYTHAHTHTGVY